MTNENYLNEYKYLFVVLIIDILIIRNQFMCSPNHTEFDKKIVDKKCFGILNNQKQMHSYSLRDRIKRK